MSSPSDIIPVLVIGTVPGARPPTCDPAIDLSAEGIAAKLTRYERERTVEALAEIPMKPGATPTKFYVAPLTAAGWRYVSQVSGDDAAMRAFQLACHRYEFEGREYVAKVSDVNHRIFVSDDEFFDRAFDTFGAAAIREVGSVAIQRAEAGPRAVAPFALPRGLMLPR